MKSIRIYDHAGKLVIKIVQRENASHFREYHCDCDKSLSCTVHIRDEKNHKYQMVFGNPTKPKTGGGNGKAKA